MKKGKSIRKRETKSRKKILKIKEFLKLKEFSENLRPNKLFFESFSKTVDIIASLMKKSNSNKKGESESYNLFFDLKKDIIVTSSIIFTILGIIGRAIGWRKLFLIPLELLATFFVATYICVKVSYEFGFDPKEKKEKKFILDLVLKTLTSKEIIKEKSKTYLNFNPKSIFILDNLKINQKIIRSIYEEIEKTYKERLEEKKYERK